MSPLPFSSRSHGPARDVQLRDDPITTDQSTSSALQTTSPTSTFELLGIENLVAKSHTITDRAQLIQQIKAGESSNWNLNRNDFRIRYFADGPLDEDSDRPKSALHSGVFTDDSGGRNFNLLPTPISTNFETSFQHAFHSRYQISHSPPFGGHGLQPPCDPDAFTPINSSFHRLRGNSVSSLSNFVFTIPTSPLAYSSSLDHMDIESTSPRSAGLRWAQSDSTTLLPALPSSLSSVQLSSNQASSHPRNYSLSYKRGSVPESYIDGPVNRATRRLSSGLGLSSELPFGSFVGSYEESILNGRMSTTPSKPLTFVAKIGVLGMGKCKPALRCPTHVTIPFPAYFYSVGDYDSPSPYVGQIDLETLAEKSKKFPYGGYRIPQQGQLQIVIKNPNKTAVKLFLVPYNLRDMEVGTKTFVRQKSYAAGDALLDEVLPAQVQPKIRHRERESLRYLIHLHICCPSRGRYYLYRNIRVVFANRVPDGKEKLRNEVLLPSPKYSSWKPGKESTSGKAPPDSKCAIPTLGLEQHRWSYRFDQIRDSPSSAVGDT
ncbi:hypothetical protein BGX38DRAFT_877578 [Terfezia claveryi]|nr:hypothetical protein BGX38DRAFT_877578 [Terfezia claveryi]